MIGLGDKNHFKATEMHYLQHESIQYTTYCLCLNIFPNC